jgi:hypothetical protein
MPSPDQTRDLPDDFKQSIKTIATRLTDTYESAKKADNTPSDGLTGPSVTEVYEDVDKPMDFYHREKGYILDRHEIAWTIENSERTVSGFSRTYDGHFLFDDRTGVVVKFQPSLGLRDLTETSTPAANRNAIAFWVFAQNNGYGDLLPSIFSWSADGSWIAMEQTVPIYTSPSGTRLPALDTLSNKAVNLTGFKHRLENANIDATLKRGNVGLTDDDSLALIDIGGHTDHPDYAYNPDFVSDQNSSEQG